MAKLLSPANRIAHTTLLLCAVWTLCNASSYIGGLPGAYLRPPVGASGQAVGGANSADPAYMAGFWNPAAITVKNAKRLMLGAGQRSLKRMEGFGGFEYRLPSGRMGVGLTALYRGDPKIDIYDSEGDLLGSKPYLTLTPKFTISYIFSRRLSFGLNIGFYYEQLPYDNQSTVENQSTWSAGGIDLGARYELNRQSTLALVIKNINAATEWQWPLFAWEDDGLESSVDRKNLEPVIIVGGKFRQFTLYSKPLHWTSDLALYLIDGSFKALHRSVALWSNGLEWQRWKSLFIRAGIGEIALDSDLFRDPGNYANTFSLRLSSGFALDLASFKENLEGLRLHYSFSTSKIWSGMNQQLDLVYSF
ncbi:MAG: hypothetical protein GF398_14055 [Chitinivibrionales bacterium]|nr:hypothetical protein [Chitinivibrionales bacterium]